jgi:hypothetical protein
MNKSKDALHEYSVTNASPTKQNHAFSKHKRFDINPIPGINENISYAPKISDFEIFKSVRERNGQKVPGFGGSTSSRFDYVPQKRKAGPGPFSYNSIDMIDKRCKGSISEKKPSWGVPREKMKPVFVDEI